MLLVAIAVLFVPFYVLVVSIGACESNCPPGNELPLWVEAPAQVLVILFPLAVVEFVVAAIRALLRRLRRSAAPRGPQ